MRASRSFGRFAACALVALAAACTRETPSGPSGPLTSVSQNRASWRFNSQKYRDAGAHAWTGRSGSAALGVEALIAPSGGVTLVVTSYRAADLSTPAGSLDKIQVKVFSAAGRLLTTTNVNGLSGSTYRRAITLPAGGTVQVQANVTGIDGRRTDVVTVSGVVAVIAPDLAVTRLVLPPTAITGVPTVLAATVGELGGQHGARASCVLYVDGVFADRSSNIWVDAGDQVSCAFTYTFNSSGSASVRVALENVQPFDADPSNNSGTGSVHLATPVTGGAESFFDGFVSSGTFLSADTFETVWTDPLGALFLAQRNGSRSSGSLLDFNVTGVIQAKVTFPVTRLEVAENADGRLLTSLRLDDLAASSVSPGAACAAQDAGAGASLYLCSYDFGFTTISFIHSAGTVTYQSSEYSKTWNGSSYDENTYVVNDTTSAGAFADVRTSFAINLQVTDGATLYALNGVAPMAPTSTNDVEPRQCVTSPVSIPPVTYTANTCFASAYIFNGYQGMLSGSGMSALP